MAAMASEPDIPAAAPALDAAIGFALPERHARGRLVRLGPVLDEILSAHDYPASIARILAEALVLTALLGAMLKHAGGQLTLQAQTESGVIDLLVADYRGGELRGYVRFDAERLAEQPSQPSLFALFGKGYLAITFDQAVADERYQGIVPLEGGSLAEAVEHFFAQSEQIPSLVRFADRARRAMSPAASCSSICPRARRGASGCTPGSTMPNSTHVRILAETIRTEELTDPALPLETLLWRLFHDEGEIRVLATTPLSRGCRCNYDYVRSRARPIRRRRAGRDGRRRRLHQRRLRLLLANFPGQAQRLGRLTQGGRSGAPIMLQSLARGGGCGAD